MHFHSIRTFAISALLPVLGYAADTAARPNIIFILCDDLGYGDIGAFYQNARKVNTPAGTPVITTPALDKIAKEGVSLEGMYAPAPVCAPSRASLLTGVHQGNATLRDNRFDHALEDNHTLASVLKSAGYTTGAIGKWGLQGSATGKAGGEQDPAGSGNPALWPAYPTKRGFDSFFGYVRHRDGHDHYPKEGLDRGPTQIWDNDKEISSQADLCYTTDLFTARAKQWIIDATRTEPKKPFFLYLAYDTPHAATRLPTSPYPEGGGLTGGLKWQGKPGQLINTARGKVDSYYYPQYEKATYIPSEFTLNGAKKQELPWPDVCKRYATSVSRIDDCVGDILKLLSDLKIEDNTIVVFTTDNGPSDESYLKSGLYAPDFFRSYGPFSGIKRDCLEGGIRVGALIYAPGIAKAGHVSARPSQFHDWMPTFAELAGIPAPARTDGVSILPDIRGNGTRRDSDIYVEYNGLDRTPRYDSFPQTLRGRTRGQMQAIRIGDHVGIRYDIRTGKEPFEVYDITSDPGQRHNLAAEKPEIAAQLRETALRLHRADNVSVRPYDNELIPSEKPAKVEPGLKWSAFEGAFPHLPKFDDMRAAESGVSANIAGAIEAAKGRGVFITGYLNVPESGEYVLSASPDGRFFLRIHGISLLDGDRGRKSKETLRAKIRLQAGLHPIRIYYEGGGFPNLRWNRQGQKPDAIPPQQFSHAIE